MQVPSRLVSLARVGLLALGLSAAGGRVLLAEAPACPQFFAGGQPPALVNSRLAQRTTLLCNDAYAVLASGVTHGAIWSAERPTAATVAAARDTVRESQFYPDPRLPAADQAHLEDYRRSGFDRGHMEYPPKSILNRGANGFLLSSYTQPPYSVVVWAASAPC